MPSSTPKYGLPFPVLGDPPNGPVGIQNLATAADALGILGGKMLVTPSAAISTIETIVVDTQTLSLPANSVFQLDFHVTFTASVAGNDITMNVRLTSVSGTIIGSGTAEGVYVSPQPNYGHISMLYKTTVTELDYFCASVVRVGAGTGTVSVIAPTSLVVTCLGPSTIIGNY